MRPAHSRRLSRVSRVARKREQNNSPPLSTHLHVPPRATRDTRDRTNTKEQTP